MACDLKVVSLRLKSSIFFMSKPYPFYPERTKNRLKRMLLRIDIALCSVQF